MSSRRLIFIWVAITFISVAGLIWILNIGGIINGTWSTFLSAVFAILSALFAFFQWALPSSPLTPTTIGNELKIAADVPPPLPVPIPDSPTVSTKFKVSAPFSTADHDYETFLEQIEDKYGKTRYNGALVVFTKDHLVGQEVKVLSLKSWRITQT